MRNFLFFKAFLCFIFIQLMAPCAALAQKPDDYNGEKVKTEKLDNKKWNELKKELDYREQKEDPKVEEKSRNVSMPFTVNSLFVKVLAFIAAIAALIFILFQLFKRPVVSNPKVEKVEYSIENIDEDLHEVDLEEFLRTSLEDKNHKQVIRIYYLMVLKELSNREIISWKKDKTNYQYLKEVSSHSYYSTFKDLTLYFEYIYYSQNAFTEEQYNTVASKFKDFLKKINSNKFSTV